MENRTLKTKDISQSEWAVVSGGSDWQAIYRDGILVFEGHDPDTSQVFEILGIAIDYIHPDPTSPMPHPKILSDVIPFDSEAAEKRRKEQEKKDQIKRIELEIKQREEKLQKLKA